MIRDYKLVLIILGAVFLEIVIAESLSSLTHYQIAAVVLSTVVLIVLIFLLVYFILRDNFKCVEESLNRQIGKVEKSLEHMEESSNCHIEQLEKSCRRIEIHSKQIKQGNVALIDNKQIQNFIRSANVIWTMNPLSDLNLIEDAIIDSMAKEDECKRIFIVPDIEYDLYNDYLDDLQLKMDRMSKKVNVKSIINILPIDPKHLFPLSFVICDPFKDDIKVWIQPKDMQENDHGVYIDDEKIIRKFADTFSAVKTELSKMDINHE